MPATPWLQHYPSGVPADIGPLPFASIPSMVAAACQAHPHSTAFSNMGTGLTFAQLDTQSQHFAAYLQSLPGLKKGDRIGLMMPNCLQYPVALLGTLRAGMVVVNINPLYTAPELQHQLRDSGAKALVVFEGAAHVVQSVLPSTPLAHLVLATLGDMHGLIKRHVVNFVVRRVKKKVPAFHLPSAISWRQAMRQGRAKSHTPCALQPHDLAFLQYTGGTTGVAKGAMLTHGNIIANVQQAAVWVKNTAGQGPDLVVTALPMYHIFCLTANVLLFMHMGGHCLLITNPRDLPAFVKALQGVRFTAISGVNTLFNALLNTPAFLKLDFSELRLVLGGGTAIEPGVAQRWLQATGRHITQAYGLTETSPAVCINPMQEAYNGSIGLPVPSTQVRIVNDAGQEQGFGEPGELCVKGPQVMRGYWNKPRETDAVLSPDGWLKTGDIATMDARGYVFITDRKKDMILVSGFNVYPNEVEAAAGLMDGVLESAAVGVPSEKTGEAVCLFVVRRAGNAGSSLNAEAIVAHCRQHLAAYKVPSRVEFAAELPKTPVGKVLKRELRDLAKTQCGQTV